MVKPNENVHKALFYIPNLLNSHQVYGLKYSGRGQTLMCLSAILSYCWDISRKIDALFLYQKKTVWRSCVNSAYDKRYLEFKKAECQILGEMMQLKNKVETFMESTKKEKRGQGLEKEKPIWIRLWEYVSQCHSHLVDCSRKMGVQELETEREMCIPCFRLDAVRCDPWNLAGTEADHNRHFLVPIENIWGH